MFGNRSGETPQSSKVSFVNRGWVFCTLIICLVLIVRKYPKGVAESELNIIHAVSNRQDHHLASGSLDKNSRRHMLATENIVEDRCSGMWTDEILIGRCWGLTTSTKVPGIDIGVAEKASTSADDCKALCCDLSDQCVSWQYWAASKVCKVGKNVRVGKEIGNTPRWCEPLPPAEWKGGRRDTITAPLKTESTPDWTAPLKCAWLAHAPGQCFGLGPVRLAANGGSLSESDCATKCCENPYCRVWQYLPDRGCFYNNHHLNEDPHCDQYAGVYIGGRKKTV